MLTFEEMFFRFAAAIFFGALIGLERESVGKEAGMRTDILVAGGAAVFSIISLVLPYLIAVSPEHLKEVLARNSGFLAVAANIVVGVGFLGAGVIVHQGARVRGLTTAATIWFAAATGVLAGFGLVRFGATIVVSVLAVLILTRKIDIWLKVSDKHKTAKTKKAQETVS